MKLTEEELAAIRHMAEVWFWDEGPTDAGWRSDKSVAAQATLAALAQANRTCATCKWAEDAGGNLMCGKTLDAGSLAFVVDTVTRSEGLMVAPTFGCVQWEGK